MRQASSAECTFQSAPRPKCSLKSMTPLSFLLGSSAVAEVSKKFGATLTVLYIVHNGVILDSISTTWTWEWPTAHEADFRE